jgi:predicted GIY-YIG superfamily endonuclease
MPKKKTTLEILSKFQEIHRDRYDYSLLEYVTINTKVKIICSVHGEFSITPHQHISGVGCRKCTFEAQRISKEEFVARSQKYFGDRYDYSLFYGPPHTEAKIPIHCRQHNKVFYQKSRSHMEGHTGCSECKRLRCIGACQGKGIFKTDVEVTMDFITRARDIHGDQYDYSEFHYKTNMTSGKIICSVHGAFWQLPYTHLQGGQCPDCTRARLKAGTFKEECEVLGVNYTRALSRRHSGFSEERIFDKDRLPSLGTANEITVFGVSYPSMAEAIRVLNPPSSVMTITKQIKAGKTPEEAFEYIPNPGYANGIIYLITHRASGKQYIGLTIQTLERRWQYHILQARAGHIREEQSLHAAIRDEGPSAFELQQIDQGIAKKDLEKKERYWIKQLETMAPHGYNILSGGQNGGARGKPTVVDGIRFDSLKKAAEHISKTRNVSLVAAFGRLRHDRVDPSKIYAKRGESLVETAAYNSWCYIIYSAINPQSKNYIPGLDLYAPWQKFAAFYQDVGQPPGPGMVFVRIDKSKGFSPENCAWVSQREAGKLRASYRIACRKERRRMPA